MKNIWFGRTQQFFRKKSQGGIAAIFAVLLGTGSLLGLIALTFDVGALYYNQQTLRESSSAAARALAEKCATFQPQCASQATATAFVQAILNDNADNGLTAITQICGQAPLAVCTGQTGRWMDCKAPPVSNPIVRVIASTKTASGNYLETVFANLLAGNFASSYQNRLWHCAQGKWTTATAGPTTQQIKFNIALPACSYSGGNTPVVLYPLPQNGTNPPAEASCMISGQYGSSTLTNVAAGYIPFNLPVGDCNVLVPISVGNQYQQSSTNTRQFCGGASGDLSAFLGVVTPAQTPVHVVLPGAINKIGPNWWFTTLGFSDFVFMGYYLGGSQSGGTTPPGGWDAYPPGAPSAKQCKGSNYCFYGKFISAPSFLPADPEVQLIP